MNDFDQTARQVAKLDETNFLAWVLRHYKPPPAYVFERWDDARRKSYPGGPDRTNDLVAILRQIVEPERRLWLILEFESEPEAFIAQRLGVYELLLSVEVAQQLGLHVDSLIPVSSVVLHLSGEKEVIRARLGIDGTTNGTLVSPLVINFWSRDAAATLADIANSVLGLCILPWIPLMAGGGNPVLIEEWKRQAERETDLEKRALYRSYALVFADLTREQINWHQVLENWNMLVSQTITGWRREGEIKGIVETKRADLLKSVRVRMQDPVPETIRLAIEGTNDLDILDRWFDVALSANTVADLLKVMKEQP